MADYKKVAIDIMENGYTVTVINYNSVSGKKFVFSNVNDMRDWLKDNLSATGEVERFSKALDNECKEDIINNMLLPGPMYTPPLSASSYVQISTGIS